MRQNRACIIGSGLAGVVIANKLANESYDVTILERRPHAGGNVYDYVDEHGINVHKYGPHIFHTNNQDVYDFITKFGEFDDFDLVCGSVMDGKCVKTAFDFSSIDIFFPEEANEIKEHIKKEFGDAKSASILDLLNSSDALIKKYADYLYEKDYAPYTAKQWGIDINEIDKQIFKRVPILFSYGSKYFDDKYQMMPINGYTGIINKIIDDENIKVKLNIDALSICKLTDSVINIDGYENFDVVVYTGAIDELFKYQFGKLPYRSLRFEFKYENIDSYQEMPVVAYPQEPDYTRITEYKKLPVQNVKGTTYAVEYPVKYDKENGNEPYYPILTGDSKHRYEQYLELSKQYKNLYLCGRLAEFKYYNMDQVIERALNVSEEIIKRGANV